MNRVRRPLSPTPSPPFRITEVGDILRSAWPIIRREFLGLLRTRRAFWITVLTVGAASMVPLSAWPAENSATPFTRALGAFERYSVSLTVCLFVFVPAVASAAISGERERGTYELLYSTQTHPAGIVFGKLFVSTAFFILLIVFTFPMAAVLYLVGGFDASEFVERALRHAHWALFLGIVGIWASICFERTSQSLIRAFVFLIFCSAVVSPGNVVLGTIIGLVLLRFVLKTAQFAHPPSFRGEGLPQKPGRYYPSNPPRRPRPVNLAKLAPGLFKEGIPDGWNPVLASSFMLRTALDAGMLKRLAIGLGLIVVAVLLVAGSAGENAAGMFLFLCPNLVLLLLALIVPGVSTLSLMSERDAGNFDFLRGTLLNPAQVLWGKFWACALLGIALGAAVTAVFACVLVFPTSGPPLQGAGGDVVLAFLGVAPVLTLLGASTGLLVATMARTTLAAIIASYALLCSILAVVPGAVRALSSTPLGTRVADCLSPIVAYGRLLQALSVRSEEEEAVQGLVISLGVALVLAAAEMLAASILFRRRWNQND